MGGSAELTLSVYCPFNHKCNEDTHRRVRRRHRLPIRRRVTRHVDLAAREEKIV